MVDVDGIGGKQSRTLNSNLQIETHVSQKLELDLRASKCFLTTTPSGSIAHRDPHKFE